ncbi:cytochrome P450 [Boletus edulis BED1]|uniref:Cytochrome P450 n=1 Tax=Boletus edulis BED1 TaxID=1328754 RepID=A0AAD4BTQ2_BOLED|nr:cytochrome P450 [Boletus edulis BED1]
MWTVAISFLTLACVVVLDIARRHVKSAIHHSSYPLPPGPRGLPFIGKVIGVNTHAPWLMYAEWAKQYGDLIYTRILGRDIIIINSEAVAKDLLDNRSRNYSDRPFLATKSLCGRDFSTIFMEYGDKWRLHRRFFHQTFRSEAVHRFVPLQHRKACQLLRGLLDSPHRFSEHIFEYTTSIILNGVYDHDTKTQTDELVDIVAKTLKIISFALRPDISILVGAFPALLKLPSWFPGMSFKRDMAIAKELSKQYIEKPFQYSLQKLSAGSSAPCMVFDALRNVEEKGTSSDAGWMKDLSETAATGLIAASDTSNSVITLFLLMMVVNPKAQKTAQAQIDSVVGGNRMPMIKDRSSLPYVDAILRETLRYSPVVPLSIPHAVVDDDIYGGFRIPKGAIVTSNLWSMAHNESKYPKPHEFVPERFLNDDGTLKPDDTENIAYGFGRRICAGRHFADTSLWSVIAKILAVFTIEHAKDENGVEIPVEPKFSSGVAIHPLPFPCSIVPRIQGMNVEKLEQLIEASTA